MNKKKNKTFSIVLFFLILISINFFNYRYYTVNAMHLFDFFSILVILCFYINNRNKLGIKMYFKNEIKFFILWPFIVSIPCFIYRDQPIIQSLLCGRVGLVWFLYFVLHRTAISRNLIIKLFKIVAFITVGIFILQQLFYPNFYLFGESEESEYLGDIELRNGLLRFRIFDCVYYMLIAFFFYTTQYFQKHSNRKYIIAAITIILTGIYLTLTRQTWIIALIPFPIYYILLAKMSSYKKTIIIIVICSIIVFIYSNLSKLLGQEFLEMTTSQLTSEDNVRVLSYYYFGIEYWENGINMILGNGIPAFGSGYYNHILAMKDLHLFQSDVGIVGVFSNYGLIYCMVFIYIHFKVLKNHIKLSPFLVLTFIASLINLPFAAWSFPILMSCLLYLVDIDLNTNKK